MNTKCKLFLAILIIIFSISSIAFAATSSSAAGVTSGVALGTANTNAVCDGGDHFWPTVDNASNCSCNSASSHHTVESLDYGNWSKDLSCDYTIP